jgi:hypothetical protein
MLKKYGFPDFYPEQRHAPPSSPNKKKLFFIKKKEQTPMKQFEIKTTLV